MDFFVFLWDLSGGSLVLKVFFWTSQAGASFWVCFWGPLRREPRFERLARLCLILLRKGILIGRRGEEEEEGGERVKGEEEDDDDEDDEDDDEEDDDEAKRFLFEALEDRKRPIPIQSGAKNAGGPNDPQAKKS